MGQPKKIISSKRFQSMPNKLPILIANLKANKNWQSLNNYLEEIEKIAENVVGTIIVCPSAPFLISSGQKLKDLNSKILLGAQDVSKFEEGPYTGEYSASQIKDFCTYSIVGHSERKKYFAENTKDVLTKVELLLKSQITPVLCIGSDEELEEYAKSELIQNSVSNIIFVHEPPGAISTQSTYRPQNPDEANIKAGKVKEKFKGATVLYGGSVNRENARDFLSKENIDGALIGQASLDPQTFTAIITA